MRDEEPEAWKGQRTKSLPRHVKDPTYLLARGNSPRFRKSHPIMRLGLVHRLCLATSDDTVYINRIGWHRTHKNPASDHWAGIS